IYTLVRAIISTLFSYTTLFRSINLVGKDIVKTENRSKSYQILLAAAVLMIAFNLRPAITSIGPLIGTIRDDVGFANWNIALLTRSEEHTSELQSRFDLVCRLLL